MFIRSLACAAAFAATPVLAQAPRPTLWDVLSVETLATSFAHAVIGSARTLADIRYDGIRVDPMAARIEFTGLRIEPLLTDEYGTCRIDAAQATLRGSAIDRIERGRFSLVLDDVALRGCLSREMAALAGLAGPGPIRAPRIEADLNYDYGSGGGDLRISADLERLVALQFHAELDYISYRMHPVTQDPVMAVDLVSAELGVTDLGAWAIARAFLPEDLKTPDGLSRTVTEGVRQFLQDANGFTDPTLSDAQQEFAGKAGAIVSAFGVDAPRIVIASTIEEPPLRLDEAAMQDFRSFFARLDPVIGTATPAIGRMIEAERLDAALKSQETPEDALALGRALITGTGAPRNLAEGLRLLRPLARAGDAEAAALVATALEALDPAAAYVHALRANAAGQTGMLALLNRVERDLPFEAMMSAQDSALDGDTPDPALYRDPRTLREAMRGYFTGTGRPRSYAAAYYWALMGAATGDASSRALRADIAEMMRLRGDAANWAEVAARLESAALRDWISSDVPAVLQSGR